jgi:hypothetical protein
MRDLNQKSTSTTTTHINPNPHPRPQLSISIGTRQAFHFPEYFSILVDSLICDLCQDFQQDLPFSIYIRYTYTSGPIFYVNTMFGVR